MREEEEEELSDNRRSWFLKQELVAEHTMVMHVLKWNIDASFLSSSSSRSLVYSVLSIAERGLINSGSYVTNQVQWDRRRASVIARQKLVHVLSF